MKKRSKYQEQLNEVQYVTSHPSPFLLPFRIFVAVPSAFMAILRYFLRSKDLGDEFGTSVDPNEDSVWLYRNK